MPRESIRVKGLEGVLKTLKELPPAVVSSRGGPVRTALRNAAKIIHQQQLANIQRIIDEPNKGGLDEESTGLLMKSLVISRGRPPQGSKGEAVLVRVRRGRFYPASRAGKGGLLRGAKKVTAAQVGALLERGTERRQAYPWARPAFEMKKTEAVAVFTRDLTDRIAKIVQSLAHRNGVPR